MLQLIVLYVLPALLVAAAVSDLMTMTISNRLVMAVVAAFVLALPFAGLSASAVGMHLAAGALTLAIGIALFAPGWIGGGDAKLAAAIALWLGFGPLLSWFVAFAILGGGLTLAMLLYRQLALPVGLAGVGWIARLHHPKTGVPYGIALSAAALLLWPSTHWFALIG